MTNPLKTENKLLIKPLIVSLAIVVIIFYSVLKIKNVVTGPNITLYSPADGSSTQSDLIIVRGKAERISQIFLNGRKIFTDEAGNFNETYLLASGYNLLEIIADDQFGRQIVKKLQLVFNENKQN